MKNTLTDPAAEKVQGPGDTAGTCSGGVILTKQLSSDLNKSIKHVVCLKQQSVMNRLKNRRSLIVSGGFPLGKGCNKVPMLQLLDNIRRVLDLVVRSGCREPPPFNVLLLAGHISAR